MRGGTLGLLKSTISVPGLSPRARGNHLVARERGPWRGPIPACAGEPLAPQQLGQDRWAYPRVRGGTWVDLFGAAGDSGLSPRARGNHASKVLVDENTGPIPACAGEPATGRARGRRRGAYPRVRGGTVAVLVPSGSRKGLSPRARGNPVETKRAVSRARPIPACAGEPRRSRHPPIPPRAYPRVRGGTGEPALRNPRGGGLSPRARGNQTCAGDGREHHGPIPACAGEPHPLGRWCPRCEAYPRVRGGTASRKRKNR